MSSFFVHLGLARHLLPKRYLQGTAESGSMGSRPKRNSGAEHGATRGKRYKFINDDTEATATDRDDTSEDEWDTRQSADHESRILNQLEEKIKKHQTAQDTVEKQAQEFKKRIDTQHETLVQDITGHNDQIAPVCNDFEDVVWPILVASLLPPSLEPYTIERPFQMGHIRASNTNLKKQCDDLLFASRKLVELHQVLTAGITPQSRLQSIKDSLAADKDAAITSIQAGKKLASIEIHKRYAEQALGSMKRQQDLSEHEERRGMLLMGWGLAGRDVQNTNETELKNITSVMTKSMSKLERLTR